jgi:hypothetical protein
MSYSQLIQFKRLEERASIFLNGKQLMFGVFGGFTGLSLANTLNLSGWLVWLAVVAVTLLGFAVGARFRGLYGYRRGPFPGPVRLPVRGLAGPFGGSTQQDGQARRTL